MDRHQFISLIKSPSQLQQSNIADIEKVIDAFPYSQTAYLLLAKASSNAGSMHAYQKLKTAAVFAGNRAVLKALINENQVIADNSSPLNLPEHISVEENTFQENIIQLPIENVVEIAQVEEEILVEIESAVEEETLVKPEIEILELENVSDELNIENQQESELENTIEVEISSTALIDNIEVENNVSTDEIQLEKPIEEEITESIDEVELSEENIVPLVVEENIVPLPANIPHLAEEVAFNLKQLRFIRLEAMKELEKRELEEISARIIPFVIDDTIEEVDLSEIPDEEEILEEPKEESIEEKIDELIAEVNQEIEETEPAIVEEIIAQAEPEEKIFQFKNLQIHQDLENIIENSRYGDITSHHEGEEHLSTDLVLDYLLAINKEKKKKKNTENKRIAEEDLIDKFIKLRPSISKISKLEMNGLKANNEDLSLKHTKLDEKIISETLANILYKQGKILSAIEMYEKLSLKNSDKKLYFEEIIQKLKTEL
ncbi:MAG: hypothetical protein RLZZ175_2689 [Bacteroidota bacterium]|jgi:hypothetical protein